jgi:cytochrome c peroxidase
MPAAALRAARRAGLVIGFVTGAALALPAGAAGSVPTFSPEERALIESLGPWPPPEPARDAGNPVSGRPAAVALGRALFLDKGLSRDGTLACVSCHVPALAFADGRKRSFGRVELDRNAPALLNAGRQRWLGWDGAADSLWSQAIRVMLDPREFAHDAAGLHARVRGDTALACGLRAAFGPDATGHDDPERTMVQLAQALGAYVATLQSPPTAFDRFRSALLRGDAAAAARYPAAARRGLQLFIGKARCVLCHGGPMFSHGEFGDIGVPFFVRPGVVDPGRHGGIAALRASRFNLMGPWAVPADPKEATKTRHVQAEHRNFGEFKVPSLRHMAATAPYMHDGSLPTLEAVVDHYDRLNMERLHADGERILQPLALSAGERADLLAFLRSLGGPVAPPPGAESRLPCPPAARPDPRPR